MKANTRPNVPYIVFDSERDYKDKAAFWRDVADTMRVLTNNNYICHFCYEDCGIYRLEYTRQDLELGDVRYVAMTADQDDEWDSILCERSRENV